MTIITTIGISGSAAGITSTPEAVYPFAERCEECGQYRAIEGYRYMCWQCV